MADSGESAAEEIISFELLPDFDLNESETDMQQLTQEQQEAVHRLMDTVNVSSAAENDADYQAFEEQAADFRHCRKTPEEVDAIAGKSQTQTTHWQTKWAVKVFKGTFSQILPFILSKKLLLLILADDNLSQCKQTWAYMRTFKVPSSLIFSFFQTGWKKLQEILSSKHFQMKS